MAHIFNKQLKRNSGGFSIDSAQLNFAALGSGVGLLVQGLQIQYQQQVTFLYDLADPNGVYYVAGRADGNLNLAKMVGSQGIVKSFYEKYGDVCKISTPTATTGGSTPAANTIDITFNTNCASGSGTSAASSGGVKISNPVILSFGLQMQVDQGTIAENVAIRFSDLEIM